MQAEGEKQAQLEMSSSCPRDAGVGDAAGSSVDHLVPSLGDGSTKQGTAHLLTEVCATSFRKRSESL